MTRVGARRKARPVLTFTTRLATGDRLAHWDVTRTNLGSFSVSGASNKTIGTNTQFGTRLVYNSMGGVAPAITGTNFSATCRRNRLARRPWSPSSAIWPGMSGSRRTSTS